MDEDEECGEWNEVAYRQLKDAGVIDQIDRAADIHCARHAVLESTLSPYEMICCRLGKAVVRLTYLKSINAPECITGRLVKRVSKLTAEAVAIREGPSTA